MCDNKAEAVPERDRADQAGTQIYRRPGIMQELKERQKSLIVELGRTTEMIRRLESQKGLEYEINKLREENFI